MTHTGLPSLGLELELPVVARASGDSADARPALASLLNRSAADGARALRTPGGELMGVQLPEGLFSFDNGYNNIEIALAPLHGPSADINHLAARVHAALGRLEGALAEHDLRIINLAEHPLCGTREALYRRMCGPKAIYAHWVRDRGWNHACGIDAKAQNGPTTGTDATRAIDGLNTLLRAAPAFIALFANSPFENGVRTPLLENRLTMWPRMFAPARHAADRRLCVVPTRPFRDLADYFDWMFAPDSVMHAVDPVQADYKTLDELAVPNEAASLKLFLRQASCEAHGLFSGEHIRLVPSARHFEQLQFSHFLDARIRFGFNGAPPLDTLLDAWRRPGGLEMLFAATCSHVYLEGRAAGACLADAQLYERVGGQVAASAPLAASALQAGLLNATGTAHDALARVVPWEAIEGLRAAAMRDGLAGEYEGLRVRALVDEVIGLAVDGLNEDERWALDYARHVAHTGCSAAHRAVRATEIARGTMSDRLIDLIATRHMRVIAPPHARAFRAATAAG